MTCGLLGWSSVHCRPRSSTPATPNMQHEEQRMYNQFEDTVRLLEICIGIVNDATDNGTSLEKFKAKLTTQYERSCFIELRKHCARFVELYDEMDTIP
jgi:hypothetical protein